MATAFFDAKGAIYTAYGVQTINAPRYISTLRQLRKILRRKRPEMAQGDEAQETEDSFWFHHDNAPAHTAQQTVAFLNAKGFKVVAHPPYSPDRAPADFFLFPKLKKFLGGIRHQNLADMKGSVQQFYNSLGANEWRSCFDQWVRRLEKCVALNGDYVEK